jgi:hypothetical protein
MCRRAAETTIGEDGGRRGPVAEFRPSRVAPPQPDEPPCWTVDGGRPAVIGPDKVSRLALLDVTIVAEPAVSSHVVGCGAPAGGGRAVPARHFSAGGAKNNKDLAA